MQRDCGEGQAGCQKWIREGKVRRGAGPYPSFLQILQERWPYLSFSFFLFLF